MEFIFFFILWTVAFMLVQTTSDQVRKYLGKRVSRVEAREVCEDLDENS